MLAGRPKARLRSRLRTARELYRVAGFRGVAGRIARLLGYRPVLVLQMSLDPPPGAIDAELPLTFGFLEPEQLDAYERYRPDAGRGRAIERLARSERCFVAWHESEIVSGRWIARGQATLDDVRITLQLPQGVAYVYDTYVPPALRRHHVSVAAATRLARTLAGEGCTSIIVTVLPENKPGLEHARRAGYSDVGYLATYALGRLGPIRIPHLPPRTRWAGL